MEEKNDNKNKRTSSEIGKVDPEFFVYTSETKLTDILKETLTHLRVHSSVQEIPHRTFWMCRELKHVQISETLTSIGEDAFSYCYELEFVQFLSNTSLERDPIRPSLEAVGTTVFPDRAIPLEIQAGAFWGCQSLRKVIVSSTSTRLGKRVFKDCSGLISVDLPEGLQVIEERLFYGCKSLPTIKIPSSVIEIGNGVFLYCSGLISVELPEGLQVIKASVFYGCKSLPTIKIPSSVIEIGDEAFGKCTALKHVQLPDTVTRIGNLAFSYCCKLEFVQFVSGGARTTSPLNPIPLTSKKIGDGAFKGCSSLSHIRVPANIDSNGYKPFSDCTSLISIELPEGILFSKDIFECDSLVNVAVAVLRESSSHYQDRMDFMQRSKLGRVAGGRFDDLVRRLKNRFDGSPLNKLCYYQSYYSSEDAMLQLRQLMEDDPLAAVSQVDEFGMTPLHILSLAQTPNMDMLLAVMKAGHRDHIIQGRDSFGSTPMDYLCLNRTPDSADAIRRVLRTRFDCWLGLDRPCSSNQILCGGRLLWSVVDDALRENPTSSGVIDRLYFELGKYEERVTILSFVELCLWKIKIDEDCCSSPEQSFADHGYREICRINSGASIVLPHLLPFLDKLDDVVSGLDRTIYVLSFLCGV
eukprot:scaffold4314_cov116-Cylindrotheca_fusiformis.AAC.3